MPFADRRAALHERGNSICIERQRDSGAAIDPVAWKTERV